MADEQKNPEEENIVEDVANEVEETAEAVAEEVEETTEEVVAEAEEVVEDAGEEIEAVNEAVDETAEDVGEEIQEAAGEVSTTLEDMTDGRDYEPESDGEAEPDSTIIGVGDQLIEAEGHVDHHYSDDVVIPYFGHVGTMPGGIYTFVFLVLGAITVLEVLITFIGENAFTITILVLLSVMKAILVIMYYMHLKDDNPIYRLVVILPLLIVLLSTLYLLGVPAGAGLGYN